MLASAISLVLLTFGSAIGLSMVSPFEGEGASGTLFAIALALWLLWVIVSSFIAGGYLAGRMRRRMPDATPHEVEMRDGAHGLTVWAVGIVVAAVLATAGVSGVVTGGGKVAGAVASAGGGDGEGAYGGVVDSLFRATGQPANPAAMEAARGEVGRMLARVAAQGEVAADDKTYIARLIAAHTGLAQPDAERRVNEVLADARAAAETARKSGVLIGFLAAAGLLVGAAGAWWGASAGGRHRDEGTDFSRFTRWR
ncbi:MAG: hypothetical protein GEU92_15255 [Alphaproteobacteria bacterium]|nr:hypothetical protein [Alphaproteobacteria bacterium]